MSEHRLHTRAGQRVLAACIVGSGAVFLEGTVVNVALPAIARDLGLGLEGVQWVLNAYLLALGTLTLLGGALGDRYGRARMFVGGAVAFAVVSVGCALAPGGSMLFALRGVQGTAGAMLVPNSLAMLEASFSGEDRGTAIGRWSGWSGVSTAIGPLLGGSLVDAASWRWVFASIAPVALAAAWLAWPAARGERARPVSRRHAARIDYLGASLIALALGVLTAALIEGPRGGFGRPGILAALAGGTLLMLAFSVVERRAEAPLLPLALFRSSAFTGANVATVLIYAALSGVVLLVVLQLQGNLRYGALASGAALLPVNALLLALSPLAGRIGQRYGARVPMTVGALIAATGMMLLTRVTPGASYLRGVLPGVVVFGLGLATLVAPLTAAVLAAAPAKDIGVASGVNNAAARLAGLIAAAALPAAAGMGGLDRLSGLRLTQGFVRAMWICAALCVAAAAVTWLMLGSERRAEGASR